MADYLMRPNSLMQGKMEELKVKRKSARRVDVEQGVGPDCSELACQVN